jgi:hypothetical protein
MLITMEPQLASNANAQPHELGHESFEMDGNYADLLDEYATETETTSDQRERCTRVRPLDMPRTQSMDRRICEQQQFFQAVGEAQQSPRSKANFEVIEGEEYFDEDDSDGCEIQGEQVPLKQKGLHEYLRFSPFKLLSDLSSRISFPTVDCDYKGICPNRLEVTKRGLQRGNYSQLHRKAWLEVSDSKHRYGKNLRLYYRHWGTLGYPTNKFFDWLDSKGESQGQPLPDLRECSRSKLDSDTVLYITDSEVTRRYSFSILSTKEGKCQVLDLDGEPVQTGPDGWIFVLRDNVMYGSRKVTAVTNHSKERFHHSSFFGGKAVSAAGIVKTDENGILTHLYPHSGHYRPGEADMQRVLCYLYSEKVDLHSFLVDMQQLVHVSRQCDTDAKNENNPAKSKKMHSLHLKPASHVAHYLSHKARCIGEGLFKQIHGIQEVDAASVKEALNLIDGGGYLKKREQGRLGSAPIE